MPKRDRIGYQALLERMKAEIASGYWRDGRRLPTRQHLERRFGVSHTMMQRVLGRLVDEGDVWARTSRGTFVADRPPCRWRYGLALPGRAASDRPVGGFPRGLERAAERRGAAHANFPAPPAARPGVKRIGFDAEELLDEALRVLEAQRAGSRPGSTHLRARAETGRGVESGGLPAA